MSPNKPSEKEAEYIARLEFQKLKKMHEEKTASLAEEEKEKLKELHFMHCPKCGNDLIEINFRKVQIDRCPECSGIWLDEGELETLLASEKNPLKRLMRVFK